MYDKIKKKKKKSVYKKKKRSMFNLPNSSLADCTLLFLV